MEEEPLYPLADIQAALDEGGVEVPHGRDLNRLLGIFETAVSVQEFAERVILELRAGCFYKVQRKDESFQYDAYGITLCDDVVERFQLTERRHWYVGVQLSRDRAGRTCLLGSIHEPDRDMRCRDGKTVPGGEE